MMVNQVVLDLRKPTAEQYNSFEDAYRWFNDTLFGASLPRCLITMTRKSHTLGYFSGGRWAMSTAKSNSTDEIAMNPEHFVNRTTEEVLSTLVHEMVHLWQSHFGTPSRRAYHNRQWADKMEAVGLVPSHNGQPDGKRTGQTMTHYVVPGPFRAAAQDLIDRGWLVPYFDLGIAQTKKVTSKTKFTCDGCGSNAWAKPTIFLVCGDCELQMVPLTS